MRLINMNLSKKHMIWIFVLFCLLIFGHGYFLASAKNLFNFSIFIDTDSKSNTVQELFNKKNSVIANSQTNIVVKDVNTEKGVPIHYDLIGLHQNDPKLIRAIKEKVLWPPSTSGKLNLNTKRKNLEQMLKGQYGQPIYTKEVLQKYGLWHPEKQGFFIEAGAGGGELFSNSLYFEAKHNWTGLLVEPNPDWWKELKGKNRNAWILPHCLSTEQKVQIVEFDVSQFIGGIINPEMDKKPSDVSREIPIQPYDRQIKVQCFPLQSIMAALDNPIVDYFSLDIEGAEFEVLKTFDDIANSKISLFGVEVNHAGEIFKGTRDDIHKFFESHGYEFTGKLKIDDFFVVKSTISTRPTKRAFDKNIPMEPPIHLDLIGLEQSDPNLIKAIRNKVLWAPPPMGQKRNLKKDLSNPNNLNGQYGQPFYAEKTLSEHNLLRKNKGFFIEAGAGNGEDLSNTLYFELKYDWSGLLVEPNPDWLEALLSKNRNAWILPHCLSTQKKVEIVEFDASFWIGGVINPNAKDKMPSDLTDPKSLRKSRKIQVQCFPLQSILAALDYPTVDYFSLDIEGAEYPVLKTLDDLSQTDIKMIGIEINHAGEIFQGTRNDIQQYLKSNGYDFTGTCKIDDFFVKKNNE